MKRMIDKYVAISPHFQVFSKDRRIIVRDISKNNEYVISPSMGIILSRFTGEYKLCKIIEEIGVVFSEQLNLIDYLEKINLFFDDFFVFSCNIIEKEKCADIKIREIESLQPLFFDILKANRLAGPKTIVYNVTNDCGFSCVYCHNKNNKPSSYVSLSVLKNFFAQAKERGCEKVILTGGDPILHPYILEIIEILHKLGIYTFLSTKTIIDANLLKALLHSGLDEIQYSVDSIETDTLKLLGIYVKPENILSTMELIASSQVEYQIKCVITSINIKRIPHLLENCLLRNIYNIGFNLYSGSNTDTLVPSKGDVEKLRLELKKYKKLGMKLHYDFSKKPHICGSLVHTLYLNENGDVSYCFKDFEARQLLLGNIAEQNLDEIWNGDSALKFLTPEQDIFKDKKCVKCKKFQKCIYYGCFYERYALNGTPFSRAKECIC